MKLEFIDRLIAAGVKRMEAASFVNPKLVPAMADSIEIMARVPRDKGGGLLYRPWRSMSGACARPSRRNATRSIS